MPGGAADVATLAVEDHRNVRVLRMDMRDQPRERVLGTERGEVRDLRLEAAYIGRGGVDDVAAESEHRIGIGGEPCRELRRFRIQSDADQRVGSRPAVAQCLHEAHRSILCGSSLVARGCMQNARQ